MKLSWWSQQRTTSVSMWVCVSYLDTGSFIIRKLLVAWLLCSKKKCILVPLMWILGRICINTNDIWWWSILDKYKEMSSRISFFHLSVSHKINLEYFSVNELTWLAGRLWLSCMLIWLLLPALLDMVNLTVTFVDIIWKIFNQKFSLHTWDFLSALTPDVCLPSLIKQWQSFMNIYETIDISLFNWNSIFVLSVDGSLSQVMLLVHSPSGVSVTTIIIIHRR